MQSEIKITIDMNRIPEAVGIIRDVPWGQQLLLNSRTELQMWLLNKIQPGAPQNKTIIIRGPLSNCIAVQVGMILAGHGTVVYQSPNGFEMELI